MPVEVFALVMRVNRDQPAILLNPILFMKVAVMQERHVQRANDTPEARSITRVQPHVILIRALVLRIETLKPERRVRPKQRLTLKPSVPTVNPDLINPIPEIQELQREAIARRIRFECPADLRAP